MRPATDLLMATAFGVAPILLLDGAGRSIF